MNRVIDIGLVTVALFFTLMDSHEYFFELVRLGLDGAKEGWCSESRYSFLDEMSKKAVCLV